MHIRSINMHIELQFLSHSLDILQAFLIVGAGAADPDLDFVFVEGGCKFAQSADDAFES